MMQSIRRRLTNHGRAFWNFFSSFLFISLLLFTNVAAAQQATQPAPTTNGQSTISQEDLDAIARDSVFHKAGIPCSTTGSGSGSLLVGSDHISQIYNYLLNKQVNGQALKDFQVAGIMGNMHHESGYEPERLEGKPGVITPYESLTSADFTSGLGWGIVQWSPMSKFTQPTVDAHKNPNDLNVQLDFLLEQLNGGTASQEFQAGNAIIASTDVATATTAFETQYERHKGDPQPDRIVEAQRILDLVNAGQLQGGTTTSATAAAAGTSRPVIVLDPGHAGVDGTETDPASGLKIAENTGATGERQAMWDSAQQIKTNLEKAGYSVTLTKSDVDDPAGLLTKAQRAKASNGAIGVSLHFTPGNFGVANDAFGVTPQKVGEYRVNKDGSGQKVTFSDATIAQKSQDYAKIISEERAKTGDNNNIVEIQFNQDYVDASGNIPMIELFSGIPWVYNETGYTGFDQQKYVEGITNGIEKAVPATGVADTSGCASSSVNTGGLTGTVTAYAWPDYHPGPYTDQMPAYTAAITKAIAAGQYVGGGDPRGNDCGGFVTRVMIDSGFEPGYNYGGSEAAGASLVIVQRTWLEANWQQIGQVSSTSQLQPGDVAIISDNSHTYMYVGQIPGFNGINASASLGTGGRPRSPMASSDDVTASNVIWFRKK